MYLDLTREERMSLSTDYQDSALISKSRFSVTQGLATVLYSLSSYLEFIRLMLLAEADQALLRDF